MYNKNNNMILEKKRRLTLYLVTTAPRPDKKKRLKHILCHIFMLKLRKNYNQSDRKNYRELVLYNFLRKVREKKIINYTN